MHSSIIAHVLSHFSLVRLFATLWTVACQAPLSVELSRQEYWSELPCHFPGDLPNPVIKPVALVSPALANGIFFLSVFFFNQLSHWGSPTCTSLSIWT